MNSTRFLTATCVALVLAAPLARPARAQAQTAPPANAPDLSKQRYQVRVMEGALVGAVRHGAELLGSQLKPINPNLVLFTGTAQAKGFFLDGYGVFFDVQIPAVRESVAWSIQTLANEPDPVVTQLLGRMRQQVAQLRDPLARASMEQNIAALERAEGIRPSVQDASAPPRAGQAVAAASVDTQEPPPAPPKMPDPFEMYTEAVKAALIDAMLEYGGGMAIAPDQWLTIAARDAEGSLSPGEPFEAVTIVLRIKGSDLAGFRAGRLTQEEARKRVEVREF